MTTTDLSSTSSSDVLNITNNSNNTLYIILIIIAIIILYFYFNNGKENMTGGTLTQLFANDSQDTYLKSNVDSLATGKFDLYWNQPTRIANTFLNRGSPLPASMPALDVVPAIQSMQAIDIMPAKNMNNNLSNDEIVIDDIVNIESNLIDDIESNIINDQEPSTKMIVMNKISSCQKCNGKCNSQCNNPRSCSQKCRSNPSSCGGGAGGYRLETGFIDATTLPNSKKIEENIIYPDSYVGSYFINPKPDISEPYPIIINRI
jgi:hypothetical protein